MEPTRDINGANADAWYGRCECMSYAMDNGADVCDNGWQCVRVLQSVLRGFRSLLCDLTVNSQQHRRQIRSATAHRDGCHTSSMDKCGRNGFT